MLVNDGEMLVNDGEMLVNDSEMSVWSYTHFTVIDEHFTLISLKWTIIRSFDHHWEAAPTVLEATLMHGNLAFLSFIIRAAANAILEK